MQELYETGAKVLPNESLSKHTTLGIGGPAEWYLEVKNPAQLHAVLQTARKNKIPAFFLGEGSNLLVSDRGIKGLAIRLKGDFESVAFAGDRVKAGAGVFLPTLVKQCADKGLGGMEALVGVPGTVGGALVMNAGTRDLEIGSLVQSVEILGAGGNLESLSGGQIKFEYRSSSLAGKTVCFAVLQLKARDKNDIIAQVQKFLEYRLKTQPVGAMNVGSIFKNPPGKFAAELIEKAGLKGRRIGQAQVSPKHANFIVNLGGAGSQDVRNLISLIQKEVKEKFGVDLEPEVKMVGL